MANVTDHKQRDRSLILQVQGLKTYFYTEDGVVQAINGVDFTVAPGQVLGMVGESGSGKSVTSLSIMRLLPALGQDRRRAKSGSGHDLANAAKR